MTCKCHLGNMLDRARSRNARVPAFPRPYLEALSVAQLGSWAANEHMRLEEQYVFPTARTAKEKETAGKLIADHARWRSGYRPTTSELAEHTKREDKVFG